MRTNYLIIALVAFATSATVFELASRDLDNRKVVRIIDLPQATPEALRLSGIDEATIAEYEASRPKFNDGAPLAGSGSTGGAVNVLDMEVASWPGNRATQNTPRRSPAILHNSAQFGVETNDVAAERSRKAIAETRPVELSSSIATQPTQEVKPAISGTKPLSAGSSHQNKKPRGLVRGTRLTKAQLADEVRRAIPGLPKAEVDAAVWIIWRESGGNPNARNPRSSSHGLNGFISQTWRTVTSRGGPAHGLDPRTQILALQHYAIPRYGSFVAAKRHHERKRWY